MHLSPVVRLSAVVACICFLGGCETNAPLKISADDALPIVAFMDVDRFDHQLAASLASAMVEVSVPFYDQVSPNKMPERMKMWVNHVEKNGGKIQMVEPPSSSGITAKDPFLLLSLINAIRSLVMIEGKLEKERVVFSTSKNRDMKVMLARNTNNEVVIDKIIFIKTSPSN